MIIIHPALSSDFLMFISGEPTIRILHPEGHINIQENHFQAPQENIDYLKSPAGFPLAQVNINFSIS